MRMWMVDPQIMCVKHLLGEHVECHMFLGTLKKQKKVNGYFRNNLFQPQSLFDRHEVLAQEMKRRGYNHNSNMDRVEVFKLTRCLYHNVDENKSLNDLISRCSECKKRFLELNY